MATSSTVKGQPSVLQVGDDSRQPVNYYARLLDQLQFALVFNDMDNQFPGPGTWGKAIHKSAFLRVIELLANPLFDSLPELIVWSHFRAAWSPTGLPLDLDWYPCDVAHWSNRRLYLQMPTLKSARLANREDINFMNARFYSSDREVSLTIQPLFDKLLS